MMTAIVVIFAEVLPKTYAITNTDRFALAVAPLVRIVLWVFAPVTIAVSFIVRGVLRLFGVDVSEVVNVLSPHDELRGAINLHHRDGGVVKRHRHMQGGILALQA